MAELDEMGFSDPYGPVDLDDLDPEDQARLASLNLEALFDEEIAKDELDPSRTRFLLARMAQFGLQGALPKILGAVEKFYPLIPEVARYVRNLPGLEVQAKHSVGTLFLGLLDGSTVSHLEFNRMWLLSIFESNEWNNEAAFAEAYVNARDDLTKRELILALGASKQAHWFRMRKRTVSDLGPWLKRAFIYGASCLANDERFHWYRSIKAQGDILDQAVAEWAHANPIG